MTFRRETSDYFQLCSDTNSPKTPQEERNQFLGEENKQENFNQLRCFWRIEQTTKRQVWCSPMTTNNIIPLIVAIVIWNTEVCKSKNPDFFGTCRRRSRQVRASNQADTAVILLPFLYSWIQGFDVYRIFLCIGFNPSRDTFQTQLSQMTMVS